MADTGDIFGDAADELVSQQQQAAPPAPVPAGNPMANTGGGAPYGPTLPRQGEPGARPEPGLSDPSAPFVQAPVAGALQAGFQAKDFVGGLLGQAAPVEADRSSFRQSLDASDAKEQADSGLYGLTEGVSQFSVGMLGAGKLAMGAKAVAGGFDVLESIFGAGKIAEGVGASVKAAAVGATVFDPHSGNFANMMQAVPWLANPVAQFLSTNADDSDALGRIKNGMASLGFDALLTGTLTAALKLGKTISSGASKATVEADHVALQDAIQAFQVHQDTLGGVRDQLANDHPQFDGLQANARDAGVGVPANANLPPPKTVSAQSVNVAGEGRVAPVGAAANENLPAETPSSKWANDNTKDGVVLKAANDQSATISEGPQHSTEQDNQPPTDEPPGGPGSPGGGASRRVASQYQPFYEVAQQGSEGHGQLFSANAGDEGATSGNLALKSQAEPVYLKMENPFVHDMQGAVVHPETVNAIIEEAKAHGHDSVVFKNTAKGDLYAVIHADQSEPTSATASATTTAIAPDVGIPFSASRSGEATVGAREASAARPGGGGKGPTGGDGGGEEPPEDVPGASVASPAPGAGQGGASLGGTALPKPKTPPNRVLGLSQGQIEGVISKTADDLEAQTKFGGFQEAIDNGHVFGTGSKIPWQRYGNAQSDLKLFIARIADELESPWNKQAGGAVISDNRQALLTDQWAKTYGLDPMAFSGAVAAAGAQSKHLTAMVNASYTAATRIFQDVYALNARIKAGDLSEFNGSLEDALASRQQQLELAVTAYGNGRAIVANAARVVRSQRSEFQIDPATIAALRNADPKMLGEIIDATKGDPGALAKASNVNTWVGIKRGVDFLHFMYINNLISGPMTHARIFLVNSYMTVVHPMERIVGSPMADLYNSITGTAPVEGDAKGAMGEAQAQATSAPSTSQAVRASALAQYGYMVSSLGDSFQAAVKAFSAADSIISPNVNTVAGQSPNSMTAAMGPQIAAMQFRPINNVSDALSNVYTLAAKGVAFPSRGVSFQDELVKQTVYRSKLLADAQVEGIQRGLSGADLAQHIKDALYNGFDEAGRATNARILNEAKIATFQNDLNPGTMGAWVSHAVNTDPTGMSRWVLPFVRTPANLFRGAIKYTPGLNLFQTEFRDMIQGRMGIEQQSQAMGQMAMGTLLMGTAGMLAANGSITGSGPSDPRAKAALLDTGWRENSFVMHHPDGTTTYVPFNLYDPVAMPMSFAANIVDAMHAHGGSAAANDTIPGMLGAAALGMMKNMTDKLYLQNIAQLVDALQDPDHGMWKYAGGITAGLVPWSSALRLANPDPLMREAKGFIDKAKSSIPGFSQDVPARRDAFGEKVDVHKGLWLTDKGSVVDNEVNRMGQQGFALGPMKPQTQGGVDLRTITMADGTNAYEKLQDTAQQPTPGSPTAKDLVANLMATPAYQNAPDGNAETKFTKLSMMTNALKAYRGIAERTVLADPNVREAVGAKQRAANAAVSAQSPNPTPTNTATAAFQKLGAAFGASVGPVAAPVAPTLNIMQGQR